MFSDVYGFTGRIYVLQISNAEMLYRIKSFVTDHVIQTFDAQSYTTSLLNHKTFKLYIVEVKKYITAQKRINVGHYCWILFLTWSFLNMI